MSISVISSASTNLVFWNDPIGVPNALRSLHVVHRLVERGARLGDAADRDRHAAPAAASAVSWAKPLPSSPSRFSAGTRTSVNDSSAVSWRVQAELVQVAAALEAGHAALEDQQRHALVPVLAGAHRGDHQVGVDAVGDEGLAAVDDVVVAVALRARADAGQVGAGAGLGHRDRGDQLAGRDAGQPALLLLVGRRSSGSTAGRCRCAGVMPEPGAADAGQRDLLVQDLVEPEVVDPAAAVLLRAPPCRGSRCARPRRRPRAA